jgi:DNA-binding NarL/FixJ family response regulator
MGGQGRIRILIADDHEIVRKGLELVLQLEAGFQVVGAVGSGKEATTQAIRLQPDVVLLDLLMPDADGVAVTRLIKKGAPNTRVLILTGHVAPELLLDALQAGADGYLMKDIGAPELCRAIRAVADGEAYLQPPVTRYLLRLLARDAPRSPAIRGSELTPRELEILQLMASHTTQEVAERLSIGVETVRTHVKNILHKLDAPNRTQAVLTALKKGLIKV